MVAGTSPEVDERLDAIHFLAYDPIEDSAALRQVEAALGNHVFSLGDTAQADTTAEATTFVYVNGFANLFGEAAKTAGRVEELRREVPLFQKPAFESKLFYNRTYFAELNETPEQRQARCVDLLNRRRRFLGHLSRPLFMTRCAALSEPNPDLDEAAHQLWNLLIGSTVTDIDARALADSPSAMANEGASRSGNTPFARQLYGAQALVDLRGVYNYSEERDSTCVAAMSLAAPVSGLWGPLPSYRKKGIVFYRDPVADQPLNDFPRMDNTWVRDWTAIMLSIPPGGTVDAYYKDRYSTYADSIHQARTYVLPSESRTRIKEDLETLYNGCSAHAIFVGIGGKDHQLGDTFVANAQVVGKDFEPLNGRRIIWSSSNPAVASIDSTGGIRALALGTTVITARNRMVKHQVELNVHEASPYPPGVHVFDEWLRTVPGPNGETCNEKLEIGLDARLTSVCDGEPQPVRLFGVAVNAPYVRGKLAPSAGISERWNIALEGDGNTLGVVYTRYPTDPAPVTLPSFTRDF